MRIIAGSLKGRRLKSPAWEGLRPTSDSLRETLFNIVAPRVGGARVADVFAGTGAVGIEAMSRGATHVTFFEADRRAAAAGEEVAGETFVFGFYGYSDGSGLSFYHYAGRLEDVPVHHLTRDGKLALHANSDVKAALLTHGVRLTHNREEWLEAVGAHVSRRELARAAFPLLIPARTTGGEPARACGVMPPMSDERSARIIREQGLR